MDNGRAGTTGRGTPFHRPRPGVRFARRLSRDHVSERGAALVEAMLVLPILILVCFGLIEFGLIYKDTLKIASAARAGARTGAAAIKTDGSDGETPDADFQILQAVQAALGPLANANHQDTQIVVYKASGADGTPATSGCGVVAGTIGECNAYTGFDLLQMTTADFVTPCTGAVHPDTCGRSQSWPAASRKILFTDPSGPEWLGVWVKTRHDYTTAVFGQNRTLSDQTVLRLEPPGVNPNLYATTPTSFSTTTNPALTAVQGTVWNDANKDGTYQPGVEPVLSGVTWRLTDTTTSTTTGPFLTSASGTYSATTNPGDTYKIVFTAPGGDTFTVQGVGSTKSNVDGTGTSPPWTSVAGQIVVVNAGLVVPNTGCTTCGGTGSLSGFVWNDVDNDGIKQAEAMLKSITVTLYLAGQGSALASTQTDVNGNYRFGTLSAGNYTIIVTNPGGGAFFVAAGVAGSTAANDSDVNPSGRSGTITVVNGADTSDNDAGIYVPPCLQSCGTGSTATISGVVWNDLNYDGIRGSEPFVSGESVQLINPINGQLIATATTDASGHYAFTALVAGLNYQVRVLLATGQPGFSPQHAAGGDTATDSDVNSSGYTTTNILARAATDVSGNDAGIIFPSISGVVWIDANKDGIRQISEAKISGVTVKLLKQSDGLAWGTTTTDGNGFYQFSRVPSATYQVQFVLPATYTFSPANRGSDPTIDSDADPTTGQTPFAAYTVGTPYTNIDAGLIPPVVQTTTTVAPTTTTTIPPS